MHNAFHILRSQENLPKRYRQARAMHIIAGLMLLPYALEYALKSPPQWMELIGILIPALCVVFVPLFRPRLLQTNEANRIFRILEAGFLIMGGMHFLQNKLPLIALLFIFLSGVMLLLLWMESRIFQEQYIRIDAAGILIEWPLRNQKIPFTQIKKLVFNQQYLTLIFRNEEIRQFAIEQTYHPEEIQELQSFLKQQIPDYMP